MPVVMPRPAKLALLLLFSFSTARLSAGQRFLAPPEYRAGIRPVAVAVADFNGDGKPDVVVGNQGDGTISILLNKGDGMLLPAVNYQTGSVQSPYAIAVGDVNGDGKIDIVTGGSGVSTGELGVFLGNGDGTFQAGGAYASASQTPNAIALADLNGDGKMDLVVNSGLPADGSLNAVISVLIGKGDGTFKTATTVKLPNLESTTACMAIGDFNGDSKIDVAAVDRGTLTILLGKGDGTFQSPAFYTAPFTYSIAAGDLNVDHALDLVLGNYNGTVSVLLGNGDGTFQNAVNAANPVIAWSSAIADLNGDGKLDVITAGTNSVTVFLGDGKGGLSAPVIYASTAGPASPGSLTTTDLNGDGHLDVVSANYDTASISTILGNADGTLQTLVVSPSLAGPMLAGDFNGDGNLDIVASIQSKNEFSIFLGNGDGTLKSPASFPVGTEPISITVADFNGDGKLDVATANYSTISVVFGNGDGTFKPAVNYGKASNLGNPSTYITAADLSGDGKPDLAVVTLGFNGSPVVAIMLNKGNGSFLPAVQYPITDVPKEVTFADFNGDGILDMATIDSRAPFPVSILMGNGDGTFQTEVNYATQIGSATGLLVADVNGDGKQDVLVMWGVLGVLLGNGDGTLQRVTYNGSGGGIDILASDLNGDGKIDVTATARGYLSDLGVYYGNGDGTFNFTTYGLGAEYHAVGHFNSDNAPDVAIYNGVGVVILPNTGGTSDVLTSSVNPSTLGQSVTFKASVSATVKGAPGTPSGTVTFRDGSAKLGTVTVRNGLAFFSTSKLSVGTHNITANYSGDSNFNPNVSAVLSQTVHP